MIRLRTLWLPKLGHTLDEYEDAAASSAPTFPLRAALADGATESMYASGWARHLAAAYVDGALGGMENFVEHVRFSWRPSADLEDVPWYVEAGASEGAHASFLGITVEAGGTWRADGVGDVCLFHLRSARSLSIWPIDDPDAFSHRPILISSNPSDRSPQIDRLEGTWLHGDAFILASDALSAWLMRAGPHALLDVAQPQFRLLVDVARRSGAMRNDDVTALIVSIDT